LQDCIANKLHQGNQKVPFEYLPVAYAFFNCSVPIWKNTSHPVRARLVLDLALYWEYIAGVHADIAKDSLYCVGMSLGSGLLWSKRANEVIPCPVLKLLRLGTRGVDFTQQERVLA